MPPFLRRLADLMLGRSGMPREVLVLTLNAFFVAVGFGVMMPVLPVYARSFGVDNFMISWVISAFALMRICTAPFTGKLMNLLSERLVLGIGVLIVAVSSAAAGLAGNFWALLVLRALGGVGSAMFTVSSTTILLKSVAAAQRGRASGFYQGGFLVGSMIGPGIGGIVSLVSINAPFFFYAITCAIGGALCLTFIREPRASDLPQDKPAGKPITQVLPDRGYQAALAAAFSQGWQAMGVRSSLIPIFITQVLHRAPAWTGYVFAAAAVAQTLALAPAGRWTDTIGRRPMLLTGCLASGLLAFVLPFAPNIWVLGGLLMLFGLAAAALGTAPTAAVGDAAGPHGGTAVAVYSMTSDLGVIIGPLVAGFIADRVGMQAAFVPGAALLLVAALVAARMPKGRPHAPADDATVELADPEEQPA